MSAEVVEVTAPPALTRAEARDRIAAAAAARDEGMAWAELAEKERGGWFRALADQAIAWFALTMEPFSANTFRDLLPEEDGPWQGLMGSRFTHASKNLGIIRWVGDEPSLKKNTHLKGIGKWVGVDDVAERLADLGIRVKPHPPALRPVDSSAAGPAGDRYGEFLASKTQAADRGGFDPTVVPDHLFDFQKALLEFAVRQGRGALFADCGLGKTPLELAWAQNVHAHTGRRVLLLTPLAVGFQVIAESVKFDADAAMSRNGRPADAVITVSNYEQAHKFDPDDFAGVICDESSAIKSFDGVTRAQVTELLRTVPYRLLGTATAAPNDYTELGTASEALGHLGYTDMLGRFFTNNQRTTTSRSNFAAAGRSVGWRFKGHAEEPFWRWVASWARAIRRPSDYGFTDDGFALPELLERPHVIETSKPHPEHLFDVPAVNLQEERAESRRTLDERCEKVADLLDDVPADGSAVAWCQLNDESARLARLIDGAVEVTGSDSPFEKEEKLTAFSRGEIRVLVTKPSIGAWGLNWQHCHRMAYFPTHSYEQYYQAVRRSWRFGQTEPVTVDLVTTKGGERVLANLRRKAVQADEMFDALIAHMNRALTVERGATFDTPMETPSWLNT